MSTDSHGYDAEPAMNTGSSRRSGTTPRAGSRPRRGEAPPRRRRKARRVHRVLRHVDIWSLAKIGGIYVACGYVIAMISGYILWRAADIAGTIEGIEGFMEDTGGYDTFVMRGDVVFSSALLIGAVLSLLAVCLIILAGILFNLISDLTGGIRMTVIDEDLLVTPARRGAPPRRPAPRPAVPVDDDVYDDAYDGHAYDDTPMPSTVVADEPTHVDDHDDEVDEMYDDHDDIAPGDDHPVTAEATALTPGFAAPAPVAAPSPAPRPVTPTWDRPDPRPSDPPAGEAPLQRPAVVAPTADAADGGDRPRFDPTDDTVRGGADEADVVSPPAPVFRDDPAPASLAEPEPDDTIVDEPAGPAPDANATSGTDGDDRSAEPSTPVRPAEPEPEPTGTVDPAFDRLLAGAGAGDVATEDDDDPDPTPPPSRFEIDFG